LRISVTPTVPGAITASRAVREGTVHLALTSCSLAVVLTSKHNKGTAPLPHRPSPCAAPSRSGAKDARAAQSHSRVPGHAINSGSPRSQRHRSATVDVTDEEKKRNSNLGCAPPAHRAVVSPGHTVRTQHGVTASAGQRRGDVEIRNYLQDAAGRRSLVFDLSDPRPLWEQ
jgi:hypothetical protein